MKIAPEIPVTREMTEAAEIVPYHDGVDPHEYFAEVYRLMRALEPGVHQGVQERDFRPATMGLRRG